MAANDSGDDNISRPGIITFKTEEQLMRDDITKEIYMPVSPTFVIE